jgi:hypothetical protein
MFLKVICIIGILYNLIPSIGIRNTTTVFDNPERERVRMVSSCPCYLYAQTRGFPFSHDMYLPMEYCGYVCALSLMAHVVEAYIALFCSRGAWSVLDERSG